MRPISMLVMAVSAALIPVVLLIILALALALVQGCGATMGPPDVVLQVRGADPAADRLASYAARAWAAAGVPAEHGPGRVVVHIVPRARAAAECDRPGQHVDGCARHIVNQAGPIYVATEASDARQLQVAVHELGHLLRGQPGHLDCPDALGDDVMCPFGAPNGTPPTDRDIEFVTGVRP